MPATRDEVGELATTLNAMLASLERARESEQRFVADASHELRTPLTALRGNAAYVARHGADPAVLADIEAGAARLASLLDDLLALAREDAAAPAAARGEAVALAELARTVAATDAGTQVVVEPGAEAATVRAEPVALEHALGNLVRNARTHGPRDGAITVTVALTANGERARVTVADEGPGLGPDEARHAFERFWRGSSARAGGSGLGLAIVRATVERHGGSVGADGPRFTIELPAVRDLSDSGRRTPAAET
jgi:signal transduction histidine kinase